MKPDEKNKKTEDFETTNQTNDKITKSQKLMSIKEKRKFVENDNIILEKTSSLSTDVDTFLKTMIPSSEKVSTIGKRIESFLEQHKMKQKDLANLCKPYCAAYGIKIPTNAISQYVLGKARPNQDRLTILSKAMNVSEVWLLGYDVPQTQNIPQKLRCLQQSYNLLDNIQYDFYITAEDDAMSGDRIYSGDIVFLKKEETVNNGEIFAVEINDTTIIRRICEKKNITVFTPSNPDYDTIIYTENDLDQIIILGKAVAFLGKISK